MTVRFATWTPSGGLTRSAAETFTYPGGELHLKNITDQRDSSAVFIADVRFQTLNDLGYAALFANVAHARQLPFVLLLPYLPASRSDHYDDPPVGVDVYSQLVNSMNPQQVIGVDAHSPIVHRYMPKLTELESAPLVERVLNDVGHQSKYDAVIAPDKGAKQRAQTVADLLGVDLYHAEKHREQSTGKILDIKMSETLPTSGCYLLVDDICDGGGTFKGLAKATGLDADHLGLWVTHGIFSGAAGELRDFYSNIYTTDSHPGHGNIRVQATVVPTETYMLKNMQTQFVTIGSTEGFA